MPTESKYEERHLADLKPFPLQDIYFTNLSDNDLQELADDIERNELRELPHVLPENSAGFFPNTILDGHQRIAALQLNGYETVDVLVRYDLADADAETIERCFLDANQNRRHLTKLEQARIALRTYEIEKNRPHADLDDWEYTEARDRVGAKINMSERDLLRYMRVLDAPYEVQQAFNEGSLPLVTASQVAGLHEKDQRQIVKRMRDGEDARTVITEYINSEKGQRPIDQVMRQFAKKLGSALDELEPRFGEILTYPTTGLPELLDRFHRLASRLTKRFKEIDTDYCTTTTNLQQEIGA